jgi:tetratricopeptide (TPR) repeat protein
VPAAAALALLTFLAFANSFSAGFVLDNKGLLLQDPRIRELTAENIRLIFQHTYWWPTGEAGLYRPFTTLSFLFNYAVLGNAQEPAGYHGVNFFLHLGNVFLVYALARRLLRPPSVPPFRIAQSEALRNGDRESTAEPQSIPPLRIAQSEALRNDSRESTAKPQSIPPLRIAQSEALRNDSRESTAKPRPQSFALRNPEARNPAGGNPGRGAAFFVAAVWAVHPVLTESVTNIIGRSDLFAALAILSGLLMYLQGAASAGWRRLAWFAGLMAATTVGVFSKESAVAIVGIIALYELTWWKERKQWRAFLLGCAATLLPIAVMLYQRAKVLAASRPAEFNFTDNPIAGTDFWTGRLTAIAVIPRYLGLTLWPATLSSDYSYAQIPLAHAGLATWAAVLAVLAAVILVAALYWWNRTAFFLVSFAAITFVPTANLLFPIGTIMAERFLYIPAVGLLACLVMGIYAIGKRVPMKHFAPVVLCVITAAFAIRTVVRNGDWQDELAMSEATVRASPNSYKAHERLASFLYANHEVGSNRDRAIEEADRAVAILDSLDDAHNNPTVYRMAGSFHLAEGDLLHERDAARSAQEYARAAELLKRSVAIDKSGRAEYDRKGGAEWARRHSALAVGAKLDPEARWMLAAAYWRLGKADEAGAVAREALALHPKNAEAYRQIAFAFATQDRIDDAATALIEGALITSNRSLRTDLLDLYRDDFSDTCAITAGPNGAAVNLSCERVHKQFCAASVEVVKAALEDEHGDEARQQKQDFLHKYGCPAGPLEQVLPD